MGFPIAAVALRKESVDRNGHGVFVPIPCFGSLSARRAWIEIGIITAGAGTTIVALRKESVDRNFYFSDKDADWVRSLSARRAWIEIPRRPGDVL